MLLEPPGAFEQSTSWRFRASPEALPESTHALPPAATVAKKLVEIQDVRRILQDVRAQLQDVPSTKVNGMQDVCAQMRGVGEQPIAPPVANLVESKARRDVLQCARAQLLRMERPIESHLGWHQSPQNVTPTIRASLNSSIAGIAPPPATLRLASPISKRRGSMANVGLSSSRLLNTSSTVSAPLGAATNGAQLLGGAQDTPKTITATDLHASTLGSTASATRLFGTSVDQGSSYLASTPSVPQLTGFGGIPSKLRERAKSVSSSESKAGSSLACGNPSLPPLMGGPWPGGGQHIAPSRKPSSPTATPRNSVIPSMIVKPHIAEQLKSSRKASLDFDWSVPCVPEGTLASDYKGNSDDPMDRMFATELQNLKAQSVSQLSIARSGHGLYYVDGRQISVSLKGDGSDKCGNAELFVRELDIGDCSAESSLQSYLLQAANVNIALHGGHNSYVARLPPESRLTFADTAPGQQTSELNELGVYDRCMWMRLACEQASLRESNAKAIGRTKFKI